MPHRRATDAYVSPDASVPSRRRIRLHALGGALAVLVIASGVQWMVYQVLLDGYEGLHYIGSGLSAILAGVLIERLETADRRVRLENARRLQVVAETNHHIRNALQSISYTSSLTDPKAQRLLREAVERIEWVLHEVLPDITASVDVHTSPRRTSTSLSDSPRS
jgi:hypothetical protein